MIFSTDNCPLCKAKLELEIIKSNTSFKRFNTIFRYYCANREIIKTKSGSYYASEHYENKCYSDDQLVKMIINPFIIFHSEKHNITKVYAQTIKGKSEKLIFQVPLLDMDYNQSHIVVEKIKTLAIFS